MTESTVSTLTTAEMSADTKTTPANRGQRLLLG